MFPLVFPLTSWENLWAQVDAAQLMDQSKGALGIHFLSICISHIWSVSSDATDGLDTKPLAYRTLCPVIALEHNMGINGLFVGYFRAMP